MENGELEAKLNAAPVGFAVVEGPEMVFRSANARYVEMVGRTPAMVGQRWVDVFPELVDSATHDALRNVYTGTRIEVAEFLVPLVRDGKQGDFFFSFTLDPTRSADGLVDGFVVIAVDVTELVVRRREAEMLAAKVRESEARYRTVFGAMDDAFCVIEMKYDAEGKPVDYLFLDANESFERHTGLAEPIGKTIKGMVPDIDESWFSLYAKVVASGEPARFQNEDAALERSFDVFASRVGEASQAHVGIVFKDVSSQRRASEDRERALAAEQVARHSAEEANRLKDEFLATVSHELRTPLNSMLGWVSLLRTGRVAQEKVDQALETIERNARSQAQLVEDLLDVSRILEGKLRLEVEPMEVRSVIEAALDTVRPAADAKGVRLQATLGSGGNVMGDAQRLQQVVWNLVANAVKFTPRGGRVQVVVAQIDSAVEITVTDTGIGISADFLPHVFERFRQAEGGSTRSQGGLGLGLSIVRHLTEMHGGTVSVSSLGRGEGASFMVRLPLALAKRSEVTPTRDVRRAMAMKGFKIPPELAGLSVLAVDDEEDSRDMIRSLLESCGARVRVAGSVEEAMRLFQEEAPSLLLSDIGMPGEDGYALIEKVRSLSAEAGGDIPAVALTAYARTEDRTRCLLAGFSSHVPKPVEPLELVAVVGSLSGRTRLTNRPPP